MGLGWSGRNGGSVGRVGYGFELGDGVGGVGWRLGGGGGVGE